jgi:acryloyl-coenzyme A reductase
LKGIVLQNYGDENVLELQEIADPKPRYRELLISVKACGVCYHDILSRKGLMRGMQLPRVIGHEVAGIVEDVGENVEEFKIGDKVALMQHTFVCGECEMCRTGHETLCPHKKFMGHECDGGYSEKVTVSSSCAVKIPSNVKFEEAAIAACAIGTELNALRDVGQVKLGETVLITGASGGLGVHGIQIAKALGAQVIALTTSEKKSEKLYELGAHYVVVSKHGVFSPEIREITDGKGVDVVIDNVGGKIFHEVRKSLGRLGRWVMVGEVSGDFVDFNMAQLFLKGISLHSATSTTRKQLKDTLDLISNGYVKPVISMRESLNRVGNLHTKLEAREIFGRSVVTFSEI